MDEQGFRTIPLVCACQIPDEARHELYDWNGELPLHGGTCVIKLGPRQLEELPLFVEWMRKIGAWTSEQLNMTSYERFCAQRGLDPESPPFHFDAYHEEHGDKSVYVGVIGT